MNNNSKVVGADIGGTHITAALVDMDERTVLADSVAREHLDSNAPVSEIIEVWSKAIINAANGSSVHKLSLAMPGPFDYEKGISFIKGQGKYEQLYNHNVKELLAARLGIGVEDIFMINDAASFLQGEAYAGAARGYSKAIAVTLGTGLGSCIYENNVTRDADLWCMPFKESIAEDYISTRWFVKRYSELCGDSISGVKDLVSEVKDTKVVQQIFDEFACNLAQFLTKFINDNQPEVVVLGGNIAKSFDYFKTQLSNFLKQEGIDIPIKVAELGEEAALLGAASYWDR